MSGPAAGETHEPRAEAAGAPALEPVLSPSAPAEAIGSTAPGRDLPLEVKRSAVAGLGVAASVCTAFVLSYVVVVGATASGGHLAALVGGPGRLVIAVAVLNSAMFAVTRLRRADLDVLIRLGQMHYVLTAFLLGLLHHARGWPEGEAIRQWSPVAVWILLFGALVPMRPGTVLGWSVVAVAADSFALLVVRSRLGVQPGAERLILALPPLLSAAAAYVVSSVVHGLNERIGKDREFGNYRLVKRLGAGALAEVWMARHGMLARRAAVKLIRPSVLAAYGEREVSRLLRLFEREVQTTATLRSPHTIQVYDYGVTRDGTFYYVMELLDGFDLQSLVERFGMQPPERVAHLLEQVCHSLSEAHARELVHRDMKPGNIYVCRYGMTLDFVKVLDFGLVLDRRPTAEELDEKRGHVGTPAVMAPEQIRFGASVDQRTDVYALGCVAYWLLTGTRVFEAQTKNDMLVMHAHQKPTPPSQRAPGKIPEALDRIVLACLSKNPDKRPQSAEDLATRLHATGLSSAWTRDRMEAWWKPVPPGSSDY